MLEELASEFQLKPQDAVDRVTKLVDMKRITGEAEDNGIDTVLPVLVVGRR